MAKNLIWKDLSSEQLAQIRSQDASLGLSSRDLLAQILGLHATPSPLGDASRTSIGLDLYVSALRFGDSLSLEDDKLSGLFSIVKEVFLRAIRERQQVDRSFLVFQELLLAHSVHRPPFSVGLFTLAETKAIVAWMLDSFYRHYKLYMYAYTDRVVMRVDQAHPMDIVELPLASIPPLSDAMTEEEHEALMTEAEKKAEEEAKAVADAEQASAEEARLAALKEAYVAAIPDEISERVAAAVAKEMVRLRVDMEAQFNSQHERLISKVTELKAMAV